MGFKPRKSLKDYHNIKHSSFLYPDEGNVSGSTMVFASLLDRMLAMDMIAIVSISRSISRLYFAALLPQKEVLDDDGAQIEPPGFHVIFLPFADDLRDIAVPEMPKSTKEHVTLAKAVVKTLRINFDSNNFENPSLQKHYASLQAIALDRETEEEIVDYVKPDEEGMLQFSDILQSFSNAVFPKGYFIDPKKTPKKRTREDDDGTTDERAVKRRKVTTSRTFDQIDWKEEMTLGTLHKLKVEELRSYCKHFGLSCGKTKKDALLQLVVNHLQQDRDHTKKTSNL
eukprot:TRINITY_DN8508_c0_g1_i6.p1 TRINITY_DN8508_c0_g1~~TRINITY_DN8508_c0_g1_i6.p1  ORF type:complete len:284 (-),score=66.18 TRINITY_DN8508_c0_g1_i6:86-937(-)